MRRMWAFVVAGAVLALGADAADAQTRIAAKAGVSFANMSLDPDLEGGDKQSLLGFAGGGHVQIPIGSGAVSVQPELLYIRKGFEFEESGATAKFQADYAEIPILLRYDIPAQSVMPFVMAGPYVAFEASCKLIGEDEGVTIDTDCDSTLGDTETESTDFGILFGGGIAFPVGPGALFFDARYGLGLTDISADPDEDAKHRAGAVMVGFSVSLDPNRR